MLGMQRVNCELFRQEIRENVQNFICFVPINKIKSWRNCSLNKNFKLFFPPSRFQISQISRWKIPRIRNEWSLRIERSFKLCSTLRRSITIIPDKRWTGVESTSIVSKIRRMRKKVPQSSNFRSFLRNIEYFTFETRWRGIFLHYSLVCNKAWGG